MNEVQYMPQDALHRQHIFNLQSKVYNAFQKTMKRRNEPYQAFICEQDVAAVWASPEPSLRQLGDLLMWSTQQRLMVETNLLKILSILVLIGWHDLSSFNYMFLNRYSQLTDSNLPVEDPRMLQEYFPNDNAAADRFKDMQYIFLPIKVYEDDDVSSERSRWSWQHRLPSISSVVMGEGATGVVTKELIAARYLKDRHGRENPEDIWMACKRIKGTVDPQSATLDLETDNQRQFKASLTSNKNIMLSFATIIRGPDLCIFSSLADCNLSELLAGNCEGFSRYCSIATPLALLQEAYCLVGALKFLHQGLDMREGRVMCAHMDLKPDNILVTWCNLRREHLPVGRWQIADFGISRIKKPRQRSTQYLEPSIMPLGNVVAQVAGSEMSPTAPARGVGAFMAPEVGGPTGRVVGQESDMWSFGCILATVLAFASGGPVEVARLYAARDHGDQDYFYGTRSIGGTDELCVKPEFLNYFNALTPNESWMASSKSLVKDILRINFRFRTKAPEAWSRLWKICDDGKQTSRGTHLCEWISQFPMPLEQAGLEHVPPALDRLTTRFHPATAAPAAAPFIPDFRRQESDNRSQQVPIQSIQPFLEPIQQEVSRRSSHSNRTLQTAPTRTSMGASDQSPNLSLTSQITPRTPQERLDTLPTEKSLFVKLQRPPETKRSRLCPQAKTVVFVADRLLRIYDLDFLAETRRWEKEKLLQPVRTIAAADIPSASQRSITWPQHLQHVATSIAGEFVALLLKSGYNRQHEARLHRFTVNQSSDQIPNTSSLLLSEPITGPLHNISVSCRGSLLAHLNNELKLLPRVGGHSSPEQSHVSPHNSVENEVLSNDRWISLQVTGEIQDAVFSHDGSWVYAWSRHQRSNHWYIWRAVTGQAFIRGNSRFDSEGVYGNNANFIVPFASSPFFLACDNRGVMIMIGGYTASGKCHRLRRPLLGITAAAIAPEENAVVVLRRVQGKAGKQELSVLHLPQDLSTCVLQDDMWVTIGHIREVDPFSGALSVNRSSGVYLLTSSPDGTLERRLIAR